MKPLVTLGCKKCKTRHGCVCPDRAFLVIDMLNDFILKDAPLEVPHAREIIPTLKKELDKARARHDAVIYICDNHQPNDPEFSRMGWPPHAVMGSLGACIVKELEPHKTDYIVPKQTYSAFFNTNLDANLKERGLKEIIVTGCVTNICVLYTVADAVQRGYRVRVLKDCVAGISDTEHIFALTQMENILGVTIE